VVNAMGAVCLDHQALQVDLASLESLGNQAHLVPQASPESRQGHHAMYQLHHRANRVQQARQARLVHRVMLVSLDRPERQEDRVLMRRQANQVQRDHLARRVNRDEMDHQVTLEHQL